jgi:hypothetical protein
LVQHKPAQLRSNSFAEKIFVATGSKNTLTASSEDFVRIFPGVFFQQVATCGLQSAFSVRNVRIYTRAANLNLPVVIAHVKQAITVHVANI